jgi:hypothetical protein
MKPVIAGSFQMAVFQGGWIMSSPDWMEMIDEMRRVFEADLNLAQKHRLNDSGRGKDVWG